MNAFCDFYTPGTDTSSGSKSLEQDKFFSAIVFNTPYGSYHKSDSLVSLNAILPTTLTVGDGSDTPTISPRRAPSVGGTLMSRGFLRSSGGKSGGGGGGGATTSTMKPGMLFGWYEFSYLPFTYSCAVLHIHFLLSVSVN